MQPFFFPWQMDNRIRSAEARARDTRGRVGDVEGQVKELTRQVDYLSIVVMALVEILRDQQGITTEAINSKIREVELRGTTLQRPAKRCGACGRVSGPERTACMFCGEPLPDQPFFPEQGAGPSSEAVTG